MRLVRGATLACLLISLPARADGVRIWECREVEVYLEDAREQAAGRLIAKTVCRVARELAPKFGLRAGEQPVEVLVSGDMRSFSAHTGRTFFTLAVHAQGRIITPPAQRMIEAAMMTEVLTHELVHLMIYRLVGHRCPIWLNEGLAQYFEGREVVKGGPRNEDELEALEAAWRSRQASVVQRRQAYADSLALTARLIELVGEKALLASLSGLAELDDPLDLRIGERSLREVLFGKDGKIERMVEIGQHDDRDVGRARKRRASGVSRLPLKKMLQKAHEKEKKR
ncbi:MAG: hypothetical protein JXR96_05755 [Deltaproteobacteria bacterium]|nr:hypothetical protein [Deltaproteobacteria bacterium]